MSPQKQNEPKFSAQPDAALQTDIVENIAVHQAAAPAAAPISEAEDIDGIMKDVSKEVKKVDARPEKHHWFGVKEQARPDQHRPVALPAAVAPPPPAATTGPMPRQPAPAPKAHQAKAKSSVPVMVIIFTLIITAFLVVAAISAYKK
jgi:hypothetical protein